MSVVAPPRRQHGMAPGVHADNGLPYYLKMQPNSPTEWDELPHAILTSGDEWDPIILDHTLTDRDDWYNTLKAVDDGLIQTPFDEYGNYRNRTLPTPVTILPPIPNSYIDEPTLVDAHSNESDDIESHSYVHDSYDLRHIFHAASSLNTVG